jgi:hypothetical protein
MATLSPGAGRRETAERGRGTEEERKTTGEREIGKTGRIGKRRK